MDANKKNFTGMPIPAAAAAIVSANLFLISDDFNQLGLTVSVEQRTWFMFFAFVVIGYFMISRWKFPSLKTLHIRVASFQIVFITVVCAVLLFYGLLNHFGLVFFVASWAYLIVSGILSLIRLISGKKSKTLEDFEPETDELDEE
jgi:CDP-diacylglycerol--serine O-phosphatidyltransferase